MGGQFGCTDLVQIRTGSSRLLASNLILTCLSCARPLVEKAKAMNESVSLTEFISSYPFPAFVLSANADPSVYGPSLLPVFTNIPFRALFVGSEAATEESAANAWIYSLSTVSMAKA